MRKFGAVHGYLKEGNVREERRRKTRKYFLDSQNFRMMRNGNKEAIAMNKG